MLMDVRQEVILKGGKLKLVYVVWFWWADLGGKLLGGVLVLLGELLGKEDWGFGVGRWATGSVGS